MHGLEDRGVAAEVGAGHEAEPADEARREVADDVAVEVLEQEHVEVRGAPDEPHAERVDEDLVVGDRALGLRPALRLRARAVEEEAVGELHDVRLVDGRDPLSRVVRGELEREPRDATRGPPRDHLDRGDDAGRDDVLEARVEVLRVLAHDHEVDHAVGRLEAGHRLHRPHVREEVEGLPQAHVRRRVADADRRGGGALQGHAQLAHHLERRRGQRVAVGADGAEPAGQLDPADGDVGRLDDPPRGLRHLGADAVAGKQRHAVKG